MTRKTQAAPGTSQLGLAGVLHAAKADLDDKNVFARLKSLKNKDAMFVKYLQQIVFRIYAGTRLGVHPSAKPAVIHAHFCCQLVLLRAPYCILCRGGQGNEALSLASAEGQPCLGFMPTRAHRSEQSTTEGLVRFLGNPHS